MYAHIFKARIKGHWELLISDSAEINGDHVKHSAIYASKPEAKAAAKALAAKPWNY